MVVVVIYEKDINEGDCVYFDVNNVILKDSPEM